MRRLCLALALLVAATGCAGDDPTQPSDFVAESELSASGMAFADIETETTEFVHHAHEWTAEIPASWRPGGTALEFLYHPEVDLTVQIAPRSASLKGNTGLTAEQWVDEVVENRRSLIDRSGMTPSIQIERFATENHEFHVVTARAVESGVTLETFAVVDGDRGLLVNWSTDADGYNEFRPGVLAAVHSISWTPPT